MRSVVELGAQLGMSVVAEGVETGPVAARLAALGCDGCRATCSAGRWPRRGPRGLLRLQAGKTHVAGARPAATV